ncbi:hypothetical protein M0R04_04645 [Candidatus Dojkabacteria bacterium]|jgi:hypothetical protein|nr:hypothetical protein [Candidatus Dojkabacteria bacterium]
MKLISKITHINTPSVKLPCLMISEDGDVYLFTEETNGIHSPVIYSKNRPEIVGFSYTSRDIFESENDILKLKPFLGSVTLEMKN